MSKSISILIISIVFIFSLGVIFPSPAFTSTYKGKIVKSQPQSGILYTDLTNKVLSVGDYVGVYNGHLLVLYMKVIGTSDRISKCRVMDKEIYNSMNLRIEDVLPSSWVMPVSPEKVLAYERTTEELQNQERLLLQDMQQIPAHPPMAATKPQAEVKENVVVPEAQLPVEKSAPEYTDLNVGHLSAQLKQEQIEKAALQKKIENLTSQYNDLNQLKDKYYQEAQALKQKQSQLQLKLDQMSHLIESHLHAKSK